ncbi:MAG TPA: AraC family transcriptional regulator [Prolixibacteraceae bacterium]|nr:AraC family transcriptional regulator [Prolixibacteraceae bacterium]
MADKGKIPVYSLHNFSIPERQGRQYQVEVFDANRHFQVEYPHRHDFFEVLFLYKGSGTHVIDNNRYQIKPPCVFFLSPGQAHKLEISSDIEGFIYIFTPEFYLINKNNQNRLIEFPFFYTIEQDNPPVALGNADDVNFFHYLFKKGVNVADKQDKASIELLRSILDSILTFCDSIYPNREALNNKGKGHLLVKQFYQLVEQNIRNNYSVSQYAGLLSVTPNHLTQTIRLITGRTSVDIIKSKQILEIKRMLVHSDLSVTEIAVYMNYSDQSYFTKLFKRETGVTPLVYRGQSMK